jgi:tubulin-specific chaperone D
MCNTDRLHAAIADAWALSETECTSCLLAGLATSADTGNEDLVIASRAAIAKICRSSTHDLTKICMALIHNLKQYQGQDRVVVPTLELIAYLSHVGLFQKCKDVNLRQLCLLTQKAGYKTGNIRKIEACIKVYGGVASANIDIEVAADAASELELKRQEGSVEAKRRLGALLSHPWPKVRNLIIDELWGLLSGKQLERELLSVDWGKAEKTKVKTLLGVLDLN